jgi:DDE superfamily endonuclease
MAALHDQTSESVCYWEWLNGSLALIPGVTLLADAGYQGLSAQTGGAVLTPRPARRRNQLPVPPALAAAHEAERRAHSSKRIRVEHGISHLKSWRALARHLGRREHLDTMLRASPD